MPSKRGFHETDFSPNATSPSSTKRTRRHSILDYVDEVKPHHIHLNAGSSAKEYSDALAQEFPPLGASQESSYSEFVKKQEPDQVQPVVDAVEKWSNAIKKKVLARVNGKARSPIYGLEVQYQEIYNLLEHTILEGEGNSCLLMGPRSCGKTLVCATSTSRNYTN